MFLLFDFLFPPDKMNVETPITDHFSLVSSFQTMGCFLNKVASSSLVLITIC